MPAATYRVLVDTTRLFLPGHLVKHWCDGVTAQIVVAAKNNAPPARSSSTRYRALRAAQSTGRLRASIRGSSRRIGPHLVRMEVTASAPYAKFVHEGTAHNGTGFIYPRGKVFRLPPAPPLPSYATKVRGQKANPYLVNGYNDVARFHRGLPRLLGG